MDHVTNTSIQHTDLSDDVMTKYLIWCLVWWKPKSSYEIQMEHKILKTKKTFQFKMIVARNKQSNKIHSFSFSKIFQKEGEREHIALKNQ